MRYGGAIVVEPLRLTRWRTSFLPIFRVIWFELVWRLHHHRW